MSVSASPNSVSLDSPCASPLVSAKVQAQAKTMKNLFQSRLAQLEKTLVFKANKPEGGVQSRRPSPQTSMIAKRGNPPPPPATPQMTTSLSSRKAAQAAMPTPNTTGTLGRETTVLRRVTTGRNIRQEIEQHKFAGLASLMLAKTKPLPLLNENSAFESESGPGQSIFARPQLPRDSRRLPARWLAKKDASTIVQPHGDESDAAEESLDFSDSDSFLPESVSLLLSKWKAENLAQRKVSFVLREFTKSLSSGNKDSRALLGSRQIAFANKCLLLAALKQSVLEEEIKQKRTCPPSRAMVDEGTSGRGTLTFRKIVIPLRTSPPNAYVLCVVSHQERVLDTAILNCLTGRRHVQPSLEFKVDQVFDDLLPDFEIKVRFYLMNGGGASRKRGIFKQLKSMVVHSKGVQFVKWISGGGKSRRTHGSPVSGRDLFQLFDVRQANTEHSPVASSAFKLFGSITIDRSKCTSERFPIDFFDYTSSPSKDQATLDLDLTVDYGKRKSIGDENTFGMHLETRCLDLERVSLKKLHFGKFKYSKCTQVVIDGPWLRLMTKNYSHKLDLHRCMNGGDFEQARLRDNSQSICLLFSEASDSSSATYPGLPESNSRPVQQFVFLSSSKFELSQLYSRLMARVAAVRKWQSPVPGKDILSLLTPPTGDSLDLGELDKSVAHYAALISNIKVN